jgi:predicted PurR-regulated permease PerM
LALSDKKDVEVVAETAAVASAEASWSQSRAVLRVIVLILVVAAGLWLLYELESVILLVVLSIFFAYLIAPLVEFVSRPFDIRGRDRVIPRPAAIGIVYLTIFGSIGVTIYLLVPRLSTQITQFVQQAPKYIASASARAQGLNDLYDRFQLPQSVRTNINGAVTRIINSAEAYSSENAGFLIAWVGYLPWLVLIPILAFFLLKDVESFRRSALQMLPSGRWRWRGDEFFQDVNSTLAAYIRAQLTACLIIGTICTIGFWAIGVPYYFLLGILAGLFEFIPLAGPLALAVIATVIASFSSGSQAGAVLIFLFVLRIVEDYVIYPRVIGRGIHLHPLAVILAILAGAELAGVAGIFLAIPVIAIATVSYRHWLEHKGSEGLVADLLKPAEQAIMSPSPIAVEQEALQAAQAVSTPQPTPDATPTHPTIETTPEEMARLRPDLLSGELKKPALE